MLGAVFIWAGLAGLPIVWPCYCTPEIDCQLIVMDKYFA
jgi:hypothetical protein